VEEEEEEEEARFRSDHRITPTAFYGGECGLAGAMDASALSKLNSWRLLKLIKIKSARSRLYRSQILQVNTRWKALAEIYTMHSFAPLSNLKISVKNC